MICFFVCIYAVCYEAINVFIHSFKSQILYALPSIAVAALQWRRFLSEVQRQRIKRQHHVRRWLTYKRWIESVTYAIMHQATFVVMIWVFIFETADFTTTWQLGEDATIFCKWIGCSDTSLESGCHTLYFHFHNPGSSMVCGAHVRGLYPGTVSTVAYSTASRAFCTRNYFVCNRGNVGSSRLQSYAHQRTYTKPFTIRHTRPALHCRYIANR